MTSVERPQTTSPTMWTIAYRHPRANRFQRATNWCGTWREAVEMTGRMQELHRGLEVWYVTTAEWDASHADHEDAGNILVASGRRVRIVDDGKVPDELLPARYVPGDRLRNPVTGATFEVVEWTHAVLLRNVRNGVVSAVPAAMVDQFEGAEMVRSTGL